MDKSLKVLIPVYIMLLLGALIIFTDNTITKIEVEEKCGNFSKCEEIYCKAQETKMQESKSRYFNEYTACKMKEQNNIEVIYNDA